MKQRGKLWTRRGDTQDILFKLMESKEQLQAREPKPQISEELRNTKFGHTSCTFAPMCSETLC